MLPIELQKDFQRCEKPLLPHCRQKAAAKDTLVFLATSEEALEVYAYLRETLIQIGLQQRRSGPAQAQDLGSAPLQQVGRSLAPKAADPLFTGCVSAPFDRQLLLEEKLNAGTLTQEVGAFVELLWAEATGRLGDILAAPVEKLSLNDVSVAPQLEPTGHRDDRLIPFFPPQVSRAEGLLLQAHRKLRETKPNEAASLLEEVQALLPFRKHQAEGLQSVSQKLDVCQVARDTGALWLPSRGRRFDPGCCSVNQRRPERERDHPEELRPFLPGEVPRPPLQRRGRSRGHLRVPGRGGSAAAQVA